MNQTTHPGTSLKRWCSTACRQEVIGRAIRVALIVGTILVAMHYTDRWLKGNLEPIDYLKMLLTYLVPYCVSVYSSVSTLLASKEL